MMLGGLVSPASAYSPANLSPPMLSILTTAIMIAVTIWEMISLRASVPEQDAQSSLDRRTGNSGCDVG